MTLRQLREARAYRQIDVAAHCNVSIQTVVAWEKGQSKPRPPQVRALAGFYELSIAEIQAAIEESAATKNG
jgi:transcriptional regulator with XRE-family HTH domain